MTEVLHKCQVVCYYYAKFKKNINKVLLRKTTAAQSGAAAAVSGDRQTTQWEAKAECPKHEAKTAAKLCEQGNNEMRKSFYKKNIRVICKQNWMGHWSIEKGLAKSDSVLRRLLTCGWPQQGGTAGFGKLTRNCLWPV